MANSASRAKRLIRRQAKQATLDILPMLIGSGPFGIIFAVIANNAGLSFWQSQGFSLFVFAGSAQFVGINLLSAGVATGAIWLATYFINLRHLLYGASLASFARPLSQRWLLPLSFWLTDETFATVIARFEKAHLGVWAKWYWLFASIAMYLNWQLWCAAGYWLGDLLPGAENWGLEFAMVATFVVIIVSQITSIGRLIGVLAAAVISVTLALPYNLGMIAAALIGVIVGAWIDHRQVSQ